MWTLYLNMFYNEKQSDEFELENNFLICNILRVTKWQILIVYMYFYYNFE